MSTETKQEIAPRPHHTLEKKMLLIIKFKDDLPLEDKDALFMNFEITKRIGVTINKEAGTLEFTDGYIERNEHSNEITGFKTSCGWSFSPQRNSVESITTQNGETIVF